MGNETEHDRELRALFEEIHRVPAPPFHRLWSAARERARPGARARRRVLLAGAVVAAAVLLWTTAGPQNLPPSDSITEVLVTGARWSGPLDFLLETPGSDLLRTTPHFSADAPALPTDPLQPTTRRSDHET